MPTWRKSVRTALQKTCYVTVKKAPTGAAFGNKQVAMKIGETTHFYLYPSSTDEGFATAVFSSGDDSVVSVTKNGAVTANAAGAATVTATVFNGKSAEVTVTVTDNGGFTEKTTISPTGLMEDSAWSSTRLADVPAGSKAEQYGASDDGRWLKVKLDGKYGDNLFTLSLAGKQFQPDYYQTEHSTHYLRLNIQTGTKKKAKK